MTRGDRIGSPGHRRWSFASSIGAMATAFLASVCCVGPLILALLGIGGAGLLVRLEPYRPAFTVLTLCLLGAGLYLGYRKPQRAAAAPAGPGCACEHPRSNKAGRVLVWVATVLAIGFLVFPYLTPYLFD